MRLLAACFLLFPAQASLSPDTLRLPCTADTMLSTSRGEEQLNGGERSNLRLKCVEDIPILDFDVAPLRGRSVEEARLFLHPTGPHKLRWIGLSSIGSPWKEGSGNGTPAKPGEATFLEAAHGERPWGGPGSDFYAVSFGKGGSIWAEREVKSEADGWISVEVPPAILHAMLEGNSFGLALSDDYQTMHNNSFHSREQKSHAPYLAVLRWKQGAPPPSGATRFIAPPPKKSVDRAGELLRHAAAPAPVAPAQLAGGTKLRVLYEGETNPDAAPAARLWDGRQVALHAARGEHVGFELALELAREASVRVEGPGFVASHVQAVGPAFDPLVPLAGELSGKVLIHVERYVPRSAATGEQKLALSLKIGDLETTIPVTLRVHGATIPDVLSFQVSLNAYNSPGDALGDKPGSPGFIELERSFHRLAHEHRGTLAIVPYSHRGYLQWNVAPEIRRSGSKVEVTSWEKFDERYGPYFDGSAFKGLPRDGVPLAHLYWPLHENWPLPINEYYSYRGTPEDHWRDAPVPEKAFAEEYGKAYGAMVREFATHAASKGWSRTQFQVFLNNKPDVRFQRHQNEGAWWRLDEPVHAEDHLALRYFGKRAVEAVRDLKSVKVVFRADLSRPQLRRDFLDGILGLDCCAGSYRQYPDLVFGRGEEVWIYGGVPIGGSGEAGRAWVFQCFLDGADGAVPWLALGDAGAWEKPTDTALLLPPKAGMEKRAYATLRLKGLRRAELDAELLRLALAKLRASRDEVRAGLSQALGLLGEFKKTSEVDAGRIDYAHLDPDRFEALRRSILEVLD
jgi:hypothetical protein